MPLYITEYSDCARDRNNNIIPAGMEPAIASQVATPGAAANFNAFNEKTAFVQVHSTVSAHFKVMMPATADPSATVSVSDQHLAAGETRFFGVPPGKCRMGHIVGV